MRWRRRLKAAAAVVFIVAYAALSHYSNSMAQEAKPAPSAYDLGAALSLGPLLTVGFFLVWRWSQLPVALLLAAAVAAFLYHSWPVLQKNFPQIYLLQECGFYGLMAASFGQSLLQGRTALCTRFADKLHGPLSATEVRYTRRVTAAWAVFFASVLGLTLSLFLFAPLRIWSLFSNFCALPLVALMFLGEYAVRRRVLPQVKRGSLVATMRVYFADSP